MSEKWVNKLKKQRRITILLTTITTLNVFHSQLGLFDIKAYFHREAEKLKNDVVFEVFVDIVNPKTKPNNSTNSFYPIFTKKEIENIAKGYLHKNPSIIGFSCFMWNMSHMLSIAKIIKKKHPDIKIIFGGPEVSYKAQEILEQNEFVDIVAVNDGEESFFELVQYYSLGVSDLSQIKGIVYRKNNVVITNQGRVTNLTNLPSPYLSGLIDLTDRKKSYIVETLRGCPFRCAYCSYHLGNYSQVRFFPIEKAAQEFKLLLKSNVPHLIVTDDNFNINEVRAIELLKTVIKFQKKTSIDVYLNIYIRRLGKEFLDLLSKTKISLTIGIQTANAATLERISRPAKIELLEENLLLLNNAHLPFELQFIVGLPGDTYEDFVKNIEWGLRFHPHKISFFTLSIIEGTKFYDKADEYKFSYIKYPPYTITKTPTFTPQQISKSKKIFDVVNIFYNLGLLRKTIVYMNEVLGINYYYIFENWRSFVSSKKLDKKKLYPLVLSFVTKVLMMKKMSLETNLHLFKLVEDDFILYYKMHIK